MKDYVEELVRLENHLAEHPADYQSKVQYMILKSKQTDYEYKQMMHLHYKRLADIERELQEKREKRTADEQECK